MTRGSLHVLVLALCAVSLACSGRYGRGASGGASEVITVKGSDTMVTLAQQWAERFAELHPEVAVQVSGGGSGTGVVALMNGTTDLASMSRSLTDAERAQLRTLNGGEPVPELHVAVDAVAIYVHPSNPVRSISLDTLARIFRGEVRDWSEVGGPRGHIVLYGRETTSGTYAFFREHVLHDLDFAAETQSLPGTAAVLNAVAQDPRGIGYGGIAHGLGMHPLRVASTPDVEPVEPTRETTRDGRYPLSRFLSIVASKRPTGAAAQFLDWVVSEDGQELVEQAGFFPMPPGEDAVLGGARAVGSAP